MKTLARPKRRVSVFILRSSRDLSEFVELNVAASDESIAQVADRAGLCWVTVKRLMDYDTKEPRLTTAIKLLKSFGYDIIVRKHGTIEVRG